MRRGRFKLTKPGKDVLPARGRGKEEPQRNDDDISRERPEELKRTSR